MALAGLGGLIARSLEEQLFRWLRAAELTCDRAALLVAQDPKVYNTQNLKLCILLLSYLLYTSLIYYLISI
jgi:hypothetical protein